MSWNRTSEFSDSESSNDDFDMGDVYNQPTPPKVLPPSLIELVNLNKDLSDLDKIYYDHNFEQLFEKYNKLLDISYEAKYTQIPNEKALDLNDPRVVSFRSTVEENIEKYLPAMLDNYLTNIEKSLDTIKKTAYANPQLGSVNALTNKLFNKVQPIADKIKNDYIDRKREKILQDIQDYTNSVCMKNYLETTDKKSFEFSYDEEIINFPQKSEVTLIEKTSNNMFDISAVLDKFQPPNINVSDFDPASTDQIINNYEADHGRRSTSNGNTGYLNLSIKEIYDKLINVLYSMFQLQCAEPVNITAHEIIAREQIAQTEYKKLYDEYQALKLAYSISEEKNTNIDNTLYELRLVSEKLDKIYRTTYISYVN